MSLIAIVAHDPNRLIGSNGELPWHLPEDLAFFKKTTSGHPIVMGRKTYQSIGRPLPKRQNIVLTRDRLWRAEGTTVIHDPTDLDQLALTHEKPIFIIGGAEIYRIFMPHLDELLVTHVKQEYQGDTYLPPYEPFFPTCEVLVETADFAIKRHHKNARS